jgi:TRAP transporter 4TM/12TM fusion protein
LRDNNPTGGNQQTSGPEDFSRIEEAAEAEGRIAEEELSARRHAINYHRFFVPVLAVAWCIFQLSTASWLILNSSYIRSIHLGFAISIAYFSYPAVKRPLKGFFSFLSIRTHIPLMDMLLGTAAAGAALYYYIDYAGLSMRSGAPLQRDIIIGVVLVLLLLEAARRVIGPALTVIATLFTFYAFFAEYMPEDFAFRSTSLSKYVDKISLSTEGIYGIPLDVSATVVFLFVLFGAMLERAGAGKFFIELSLSVLGRFKGGPAKAAIVGSGLTGMVSGSSIANIVTTGTFTIPLMKKVGYQPTKAAAVEVAASTDGQLAPPIMGAAAFIIAEYLGIAYLEVVKAAAVPAFVSYATLFFIVHVEASKAGLRGLSRAETPDFMEVLKSGIHFLIPIGVIMFIQEPVRSFRKKNPLGPSFKTGVKSLIDAAVTGGRNMVPVAIACAAAGIIVGIITMGIGSIITELVEFLSGGNIFLLITITAVASLLLGMGLPTTATYIVMAVLIAPVIMEVGMANGFVIPLMAAHLFCFYFGILADDTPPVGLAAYAAAAIAKSPPIKTGIQGFLYDIRTAMIAFMFIFNHDLILHNINSWGAALLIFFMACIGNFSFAAATQGWFISRNRWYEIPFMLIVTFLMMQPATAAEWLKFENKYFIYIIGLAIAGLIYLNQSRRRVRP